MASFNLTTTATSSSSLRSELFDDPVLPKMITSSFSPSTSRCTRHNNKEAIKAMAGGGGGGGRKKFKGTQRRENYLTEMIEKKVMEAKEVCEGNDGSNECKVAWDEVEEFSQAKAHLRMKIELEKRDPLEFFCQDHPETDECRIYEY